MRVEHLLTHAGFVRGLTRALLRGDPRVDDVVQETWLAAIRRGPRRGVPARAWLGAVVHNLVAGLRRKDAAHARAQAAAVRPDRVPATSEIVAREEVRRRVVESLLTLDEPLRSALVLRYYEELPPREVARRLGVPVETARTRIKRGLKRLRAELDRRYGDDRRAWCVALLPLAALDRASPTSGLSAGALLMSTKTKIAMVVVLVAMTTLLIHHVTGMTPNSREVQKDEFIFGLSSLEGLFSPFIPLNARLMIRLSLVG